MKTLQEKGKTVCGKRSTEWAAYYHTLVHPPAATEQAYEAVITTSQINI